MRLIPRVFIGLSLLMLLISYQNFSAIDPSEWDTKNTLKIIQDMRSFEQGTNAASPALAAPGGGSDLQSVTSSWAERQGTLLLNGYDKKLESAMNDKLNSWVQQITKKDPSDGEFPSPESKDPKATEAGLVVEQQEHKKSKQNLRFARLNSLKYDLGENTCVDVTADPGNTRFNYSQTLTQRTKVGLEHKTADGQTQMFLKYDW